MRDVVRKAIIAEMRKTGLIGKLLLKEEEGKIATAVASSAAGAIPAAMGSASPITSFAMSAVAKRILQTYYSSAASPDEKMLIYSALTTKGYDDLAIFIDAYKKQVNSLKINHEKNVPIVEFLNKANSVKFVSVTKDQALSTMKAILASTAGPGTEEDDEDGSLKNAILSAPSLIDLSWSCREWKGIRNSTYYPTGETPADQVLDEFSGITGPDQYEQVEEPLKRLPYIVFNDGEQSRSYTFEEWKPVAEKLMSLESVVNKIIEDNKGKTAAGAEEIRSQSRKPLGWGLEKPYLKNIIRTMNAYGTDRNIPDYPLKDENTPTWNDDIQSEWLVFVRHALANCSIFSKYINLGTVEEIYSKWPAMSNKMIGDFPGYTKNARGCLAFCLDAYYNEIKFGNIAPESDSGEGRQRRERTPSSSGDRPERQPRGAPASVGNFYYPKDAIVSVVGAGNISNLDQIYGNGASLEISRQLISIMDREAKTDGADATLTLIMNVDIDKLSDPDIKIKTGGFGRTLFQKFFRRGGIKSLMSNFFSQRSPTLPQGIKNFQVTVTFPAGKPWRESQ